MKRSALDEIRRLDPEKDHERIAYLDTCWEFPWDTTRALELALFRTFAVAKGSALLAGTGEFTRRPQKRYDDTVLILAEILEHGYDSERGRAALRRMNQMHRRYPIPNDEFLYVLSTFIFEPIRWNARFGWRPLTETEKLASFYYWREIGRRMGIRDIPASIEAFEQYNLDFERTYFGYAESNRQIAQATRDLFLSWVLPPVLWPLGAPVVHAMMDERLLEAVGFPRPPAWLRRLVEGALRLRARVLRLLPVRRRPRLLTQMRSRTYPHGYTIEELGTF
ncbi:MAG TPA: oxygenase MpaB family protein [Roseiflexaceae bacterium]|nr:oxygenase MpaB family protein [Roseiflexaceae bacterium]